MQHYDDKAEQRVLAALELMMWESWRVGKDRKYRFELFRRGNAIQVVARVGRGSDRRSITIGEINSAVIAIAKHRNQLCANALEDFARIIYDGTIASWLTTDTLFTLKQGGIEVIDIEQALKLAIDTGKKFSQIADVQIFYNLDFFDRMLVESNPILVRWERVDLDIAFTCLDQLEEQLNNQFPRFLKGVYSFKIHDYEYNSRCILGDFVRDQINIYCDITQNNFDYVFRMRAILGWKSKTVNDEKKLLIEL